MGTQYSHELDRQNFIPVYRLLWVAVHLLPAAVVQHPHGNIQPEFVFLAGEEDGLANLLDSPHYNWCTRKLSSIITHQTVERRKLPTIQVRWCFVLIRQDQYLWRCMFTLLPEVRPQHNRIYGRVAVLNPHVCPVCRVELISLLFVEPFLHCAHRSSDQTFCASRIATLSMG